jgi:hypothetical protein
MLENSGSVRQPSIILKLLVKNFSLQSNNAEFFRRFKNIVKVVEEKQGDLENIGRLTAITVQRSSIIGQYLEVIDDAFIYKTI